MGRAEQIFRLVLPRGRWSWRRRLAMLFLLGVFACLAIPVTAFWAWSAQSPTIAKNYWPVLNGDVDSIPESDRAWPEIRASVIGMPKGPAELWADQSVSGETVSWHQLRPGDSTWPMMESYLQEAAPYLERVRVAARRPTMGYVFSDVWDSEVATANNMISPLSRSELLIPSPPDNPALLRVRAMHLGPIRRIARTLTLEVRRASAAGDFDSALDCIETQLQLSRLLSESQTVIVWALSLAVEGLAWRTAAELIHVDHANLADRHLDRVIDLLAEFPLDRSIQDFRAGETAFINDTLQRLYTDYGNGLGIMTKNGVDWWVQTTQEDQDAAPSMSAWSRYMTYADFACSPRGRFRQQKWHELIVKAESALFRHTPWEIDRNSLEFITWAASVEPGGRSNEMERRYGPILALQINTANAWWSIYKTKCIREVASTAVRLERYRRRNNEWPSTFDELRAFDSNPLPIDPFDGQDLRYLLTPRGPVMYSIGKDRRDDGGAIAPETAKISDWAWPSPAIAPARKDGAGDWVLYPPAR